MVEKNKDIEKDVVYSRLETYVDESGRMVTEKIPVNSHTMPIQFIGRVLVNSPQGVVPIEFIFDQRYRTVSSCFKNFDGECNLAIEKMIEEEKNRTPPNVE